MIELHWRDVIRRPIITEKSTYMADSLDQYAFVVHNKSTKNDIVEAVEKAWPDVKVAKVRVLNMPAKKARRMRSTINRKPAYKKAIVTLSEGSIDLFEGVSG